MMRVLSAGAIISMAKPTYLRILDMKKFLLVLIVLRSSLQTFGADPIVALVAGANNTCVLHKDNAYCWGSVSLPSPRVLGFHNASQMTSGWDHICVLDQEGVWCFGKDDEEQ